MAHAARRFFWRSSCAVGSSEPIHSIALCVRFELSRTVVAMALRARTGFTICLVFAGLGRSMRAKRLDARDCDCPGIHRQHGRGLPVPCTFDFNVGARNTSMRSRRRNPLSLLFSGTVFYEDDDGAVRVMQVPWERRQRIACRVNGGAMIDQYYPNTAWLCLRKDVLTGPPDSKGLAAHFRAGRKRPSACCRRLADPEGRNELHLVGQDRRRPYFTKKYFLYPYRPSVKNRQRWTFGGLYPRAWAGPQRRSSSMRTE